MFRFSDLVWWPVFWVAPWLPSRCWREAADRWLMARTEYAAGWGD